MLKYVVVQNQTAEVLARELARRSSRPAAACEKVIEIILGRELTGRSSCALSASGRVALAVTDARSQEGENRIISVRFGRWRRSKSISGEARKQTREAC